MEETEIILQAIIIIIGLYLAFFKSYFQEKGKNLATKEDIEEITKKVEKIKSDLEYLTQFKIGLTVEERNSLVNCYEKYSYWLNTCFDTYFGGINEENLTKLQETDARLSDAKFQYELAESRMQLFVNNEALSKLLSDIKLKTLELQHLSQKCIGDLEYIFFEIRKMKSETHPDSQLEPYKELLAKKSDLLLKLNGSKIELYKEIATLDNNLQVEIYNHLQALLEE